MSASSCFLPVLSTFPDKIHDILNEIGGFWTVSIWTLIKFKVFQLTLEFDVHLAIEMRFKFKSNRYDRGVLHKML